MDNKEEMKKPADIGMDLEDSGAKLEEEGEMVDAKAETMDKLERADKRTVVVLSHSKLQYTLVSHPHATSPSSSPAGWESGLVVLVSPHEVTLSFL